MHRCPAGSQRGRVVFARRSGAWFEQRPRRSDWFPAAFLNPGQTPGPNAEKEHRLERMRDQSTAI